MAARRWRIAAAVAWLALAAWFAVSFAPFLRGYFLSDDLVPLVLFEQWRGEGRLGAMLAANFVGGLDAGGNHFYRPLSFLTFALHYLASGTHAAPWMAVTVLLHLLNGLLVAAVALAAVPQRRDAHAVAAAAVGAALFLFFAPGVEVAAWISGRFDAMATFFTLAAVLGFVSSRRAGDGAWWLSLAAMAAACLSKESAAVVPFAILLHARFLGPHRESAAGVERWTAAVRVAAPWLALAALYLLGRWLMFGSATRVYANTQPLGAILSPGYWEGVVAGAAPFLAAQFRPGQWYPLLVTLTALQCAVVLAGLPHKAPARGALFAAGATALVTLLLLVPHVSRLPASGLGGRLLYQAAAFYGISVAIALRHARLPRLLLGVSLLLVALHAAFQANVLDRWLAAHAGMRALAGEIRRLHEGIAPDEFVLVLAPDALDDIPFARNAQAGLMLPPIQPAALSARLLVQIHFEIPELAGKIRAGVVPTLRRHSVLEYLEGKRVASAALVYPSRVVCWDPARNALVPLEAPAAASPEAWGQALQASLARSPCAG
jgi:hypothetical protein